MPLEMAQNSKPTAVLMGGRYATVTPPSQTHVTAKGSTTHQTLPGDMTLTEIAMSSATICINSTASALTIKPNSQYIS